MKFQETPYDEVKTGDIIEFGYWRIPVAKVTDLEKDESGKVVRLHIEDIFTETHRSGSCTRPVRVITEEEAHNLQKEREQKALKGRK